MADESN